MAGTGGGGGLGGGENEEAQKRGRFKQEVQPPQIRPDHMEVHLAAPLAAKNDDITLYQHVAALLDFLIIR